MLVERLSRIALLGSTWVLYLLLALSVVSLASALERWVFFARHADDLDALAARFSEALEVEDFDRARQVLRESPSIEAGIVLTALRWVHGGPRALADAIDASLARARGQLMRSTYLLGTLGNNAPFVGLFGTVIGVIDAFHQLGDAGQNHGAMGNVMGGIAEALVATGVGLFVALPAVVAYNVVQKKIAEIETDVQVLGKLAGAFVEALDHAGHELAARLASSTSRRRPSGDAHRRRRRTAARGELTPWPAPDRTERRGPIVGINVTPMVDVVLVLLVIMMVSATYIVSQSLKVELPKTATSDEAASSPAAVTITREGAFFFNESPVDEAQLASAAARRRQANADVNLVVTADERALHGSVVHVIDLAKVEGITKFAINVDRSK